MAAVKLYLDGAQVATGTGKTGTLAAASTVGLGMNPSDGLAFGGTVGEAAVYPSVPTAAQVAYHYARGNH